MNNTVGINNIKILKIGEQCPVLWPQLGRQSACMTVWGPTGFISYVAYMNMTAHEERNLKEKMIIRFVIENDICFFLYKFGDEFWMDTPFYPSITGNAEVPLVKLAENEMYSMTILGVEAKNGILMVCRTIGLDHEISQMISSWYEETGKTPMNRMEYYKRVDTVYAKYSTDELVHIAQTRNLPVMVVSR